MVKNLKIIFGMNCNLKCDYCYQEHSNNEISYEILDLLIQKINKSNDEFYIHLFGGEPLLYTEKILYLLDRVDITKHHFSISTNGILKENFKKIENKLGYPIPNLLSNKKGIGYEKLNEESAFRFVLTKDNISELEEKLEWFLNEYGENFSIQCNFYEKWDKELLERVEVIENRILTKYSNIRILKPIVQGEILCNCKSIILNWNGDYLVCHRDTTKIIGNIYKDELKTSKNKECIFKDKILENFISISTIAKTAINLCEYDIVFYC